MSLNEDMAKKPLHRNHNFLTLLAVALVIIVGIVGVKFLWAKMRWNNYAEKMQTKPMQYAALDSAEDAAVTGMTIMTVPAQNPLFNQPDVLQEYVEDISDQTRRDLVIVDKQRVILADTFVQNVGTKFMHDDGDEVAKAIADGQMHTFVETSSDYPAGLSQTVIPLKETDGDIVGAIILSSSQIFK